MIGALLDGPGIELHPRWAPNVVTHLGRLAGRTVGVIANNPLRLGGCLDATSAEKAARFVRMCDAFGVPLVVLVDVPGYLPGVGQEWDGVVRRGAKLLHAFAEATVPRITLVMRKSYGGAYIAMNSRSLGATKVFAWPGAEIAVMGAGGGDPHPAPPHPRRRATGQAARGRDGPRRGARSARRAAWSGPRPWAWSTRSSSRPRPGKRSSGPSRTRRSAVATTATSRCDGPGRWLRRDSPARGVPTSGGPARGGCWWSSTAATPRPGCWRTGRRGRSLSIQTVALHAGEPLPAAPGCDAVVILGSELTAYDDTLPWLAAELAFIERMLAASVPVLGICFGAQALARVLGARLYRLQVPEIGWAQVTSGHPGLAEGPWLSWHRDAFDLPPGAAQIAANEVCVQGFSLRPARRRCSSTRRRPSRSPRRGCGSPRRRRARRSPARCSATRTGPGTGPRRTRRGCSRPGWTVTWPAPDLAGLGPGQGAAGGPDRPGPAGRKTGCGGP